MVTEIETIDEFDEQCGQGTLAGVVVQGLDLRDRTDEILALPVDQTVFLGCDLAPTVLEHLHRHGGLAHPRFRALPFRAYRTGLYAPDELFDAYLDGRGYEQSLDARVYRWARQVQIDQGIVDMLAQRIHDFSIEDALAELLHEGEPHRVVAIMGGHAMNRDNGDFGRIARLARTLARAGCTMASGGGPGAMEATNLGAWLAPHQDGALDDSLAMLAAAPGFEPIDRWLDAAYRVRRRYPADGQVSLGVPTWYYGHEPPNAFATHVAKYFANSVREDGLLAIATAGVVFAPGSAGTLQEVFQDATQNHYETLGVVSPMVFLGVEFWTEVLPAFPLLQTLAGDRPYADLLLVTDDLDAAAAHLTSEMAATSVGWRRSHTSG